MDAFDEAVLGPGGKLQLLKQDLAAYKILFDLWEKAKQQIILTTEDSSMKIPLYKLLKKNDYYVDIEIIGITIRVQFQYLQVSDIEMKPNGVIVYYKVNKDPNEESLTLLKKVEFDYHGNINKTFSYKSPSFHIAVMYDIFKSLVTDIIFE